MLARPPSYFHRDLSPDRLQCVSEWLLEELHATHDDLSRVTDDGYSRGCTAFARQKNRLIQVARSGHHPWLHLCNSRNDLVFLIGQVPCRFSNDDASHPSKEAVLTANQHQLPFSEFALEDEPARFCFVVDQSAKDLGDPCVEFLGFTRRGEIACRWVSDAVRVLRQVSGKSLLTPAVPLPRPPVAPKGRTTEALYQAAR